jgi:uncharacterized protein YhfF
MKSPDDAGIDTISPADVAGLPVEYFAFPGPLRDALVSAILSGAKTSTTSILREYEVENEPLPTVGDRGVVVDSHDQPVCVTEVTDVRVASLAEVDVAHARDEGEGYETVADWRVGHEQFWHSDEYRAAVDDAGYTVTDATEAVLVRFRLVARIEDTDS